MVSEKKGARAVLFIIIESSIFHLMPSQTAQNKSIKKLFKHLELVMNMFLKMLNFGCVCE